MKWDQPYNTAVGTIFYANYMFLHYQYQLPKPKVIPLAIQRSNNYKYTRL